MYYDLDNARTFVWNVSLKQLFTDQLTNSLIEQYAPDNKIFFTFIIKYSNNKYFCLHIRR